MAKNIFKSKKLIVIAACVFIAIFGFTLVQLLLGNTGDSSTVSIQQKQASKIDAAKKKQLVENSTDSGAKPTNSGSYTPPSDPGNVQISAAQSDNNVIITSKLYGYS